MQMFTQSHTHWFFYNHYPKKKKNSFVEDKLVVFPAVMFISSLQRQKETLAKWAEGGLVLLLTKAYFVSLFLPSSFSSSERSVLLDRSLLFAASLPETSQQPGSLIHECALSTRRCEARRSRIHVQLLPVRTKEFHNNGIRAVWLQYGSLRQ